MCVLLKDIGDLGGNLRGGMMVNGQWRKGLIINFDEEK